jgi:hypothetical protein
MYKNIDNKRENYFPLLHRVPGKNDRGKYVRGRKVPGLGPGLALGFHLIMTWMYPLNLLGSL